MNRTPRVATDTERAGIATLLAVLFINMLGFGIIIPLLPFYASSFQAGPAEIALIFSAYSVGAFFGEPFWGRLSDRIGRKPVLIGTIAANCACYGALAFVNSPETAIVVRFFGGMMAGNGSVVMGYIADNTAPERRSRRLAHLGVAWNIGLIVGPSLGGLLAHPELGPAGFRPPLLAAAGLAALSALGVALLLKESRGRRASDQPQGSRWAVAGLAFSHPVIRLCILVSFLAGCAFTGIESVFGLWGERRFGWGPREIGLCFAVVGVVAALAQAFATGPLSERYGQARMLAIGMAMCGTGQLLLAVSSGFALTVALMAVVALGSSIAFPNVGALIMASAPEENQGAILGLNNAAGAASRVAGPMAANLAFAGIGVSAPFFLGAAMMLPATILAVIAGRRAGREQHAG